MMTIDTTARPQTARREQASVAQTRLRWGAGWVSSFRGDSPHEIHSPVRPEDVARSELFYNSTCCWV